MAQTEVQRVDWPTAWRSALNLYGIASVLQAFFAPFAAPAWLYFVYNSRRALVGAASAERPWAGGRHPKVYLTWFLPFMLMELAASIVILASPADFVTYVVTLVLYYVGVVVTLGLASRFITAAALPAARAHRELMDIAMIAELGSAFFQTAFVNLILPGVDLLVSLGVALGLALVSFVALDRADRAARAAGNAKARRLPRL